MLAKVIAFNASADSQHSILLKSLVERITLAENDADSNHSRWRKTEQYYQMYKPKNEKDFQSAMKKAEGDTDYESVVMPYSYAQMLTAHAYLVNVFLNRDPIFQTDSLNGDGAEKELALESLLQYQVKAGEMEPELVVYLLDICRYGVGIVGNYWCEEMKPKAMMVDEEVVVDGVPTGEVKRVMKRELVKGYVGNKTFNVLPYDYLYDPRVPMGKPNDGEFVGRKFKLSWNELVKGEKAGYYFNTSEVRNKLGQVGDQEQRDYSMDVDRQIGDVTKTPKGKSVGEVDAIELYVELVPTEWGLDEEADFPEKWVFTIVDKKVIVGCSPLGYYHNKFPFHVSECEVDGYKNKSRGILEVAAPMNDILTWLFDSHMYNKRQVMNNQFVFDPSAVVQKDLQSKKAGKMIRLRPTAFGRDVRSIIHQLPVHDVTMQNLQDAQVVERNMQRIVGINDDVAGQSAPSSRRSATEFRGTTSFASNRLANMAYHISVSGFRSLAKCLISSTQQMYTIPQKVKVAGDNIKGAQSITVNPEDIAGEFDISAVDGTLPIDRMAQAQFYMQAMGMIAGNPMLQAEYRMGDLFSHTMRLAGLKGIDKMKIQILSDEQITELVNRQLVEGQTGGRQEAPIPGAPTPGIPGNNPTPPGAPSLEGLAALM